MVAALIDELLAGLRRRPMERVGRSIGKQRRRDMPQEVWLS
jgi:hypothetical protein